MMMLMEEGDKDGAGEDGYIWRNNIDEMRRGEEGRMPRKQKIKERR